MATILGFHEVDDVERWLRSPNRAEVFGPLGITVRLFRVSAGEYSFRAGTNYLG